MQELIDVIRTAIAADATKEQKAAGAQACNTIASALGTLPGMPLVLPHAPARSPLAGISFDQVLDLAIAKLTSVANAQQTALPPAAHTALASSPSGLRVPSALVVPSIPIRPHANKNARRHAPPTTKTAPRAPTTPRATPPVKP